MDKNAIKKYAMWAREELIKRVSTKALEYGISENSVLDDSANAVGERILTNTEKGQRTALIAKIKENGFEQTIEEVAYTWFNRFIALRFMEVNGYLPSKVRVFTDEENNFKPQILDEAIHMELDGLNLELVMTLKEENKTDELYKYLLITQCNALHGALPQMFGKAHVSNDYTLLLFPDNIRLTGSVIEQMIDIIPEDNWKDAVQILGWLYQFYNTEPKAEVNSRPKGAKIKKEDIPAITQLFTPDWIVRYMVENSLGRIAVEKLDVDPAQMDWKYYLPEAEQTEEVQNQLKLINGDKKDFKLEELKLLDPCMGSGHILVYAFDVLMQIYKSQGYSERDASQTIIENNIYGLDIDERAYQLAYFAIMMKARKYDRRFLDKGIAPQVYCPMGYPQGEEFGSLLEVEALEDKPQGLAVNEQVTLETENHAQQVNTWNFRRLIAQKYDVVVTNPPYMSPSPKQVDFIKKNYPYSKTDLFAVFIEKALKLSKNNGYAAMVTMHSWMFLSSYEKLRFKLLHTNFINMAHLGARAFEEIGGEVVQTTSFVMKKSNIKNYKATFARLVDFKSQQEKENEYLTFNHLHTAQQENFSKIPGSPIAYWVSEKLLESFQTGEKMIDLVEPKVGLQTADNNRFLRLWWEINTNKAKYDSDNVDELILSKRKWVPYNKGGERRQWYGNYDYLVNWENDGIEIRNFRDLNGKIRSRAQNTNYYFKPAITWSDITSGGFSIRYRFGGGIHDVTGMSAFCDDETKLKYLLGLMSTKISDFIFKILNPTIHLQIGNFCDFPVLENDKKTFVVNLAEQNISLSKIDWDSFETSWDFEKHPLTKYPVVYDVETKEKEGQIELFFEFWNENCNNRFNTLKQNEEELNRIFIDIYDLADELTPEVADKDVTVRKADLKRDIKSFISYAVGCMFGRYSLDTDGLAYAGGEFDESKYITFQADKDNIIPVCDDEYFEDDIVGKFIEFVKVVYGENTLEENLAFIANALGGKGASREVIRNYFLNGFYADHCKTYQKRPIYWQFESGKNNGFKALIYLHRYEQDTIARMRTDYVHEQQGRYRTATGDLEHRIADASTSEKVKLSKQLTKLKDQETEIRLFEEKIHHLADQMIRIDLDDGVKNNYEIFKDVLSKIK